VEVRQVLLNDKMETAVLYENAFLQDVEWKHMNPFQTIDLANVPYTSSSFCPGARTVSLDSAVNGELESGETVCYKINLDADQNYSFSASNDSGADLMLNLYDKDGIFLTSDDGSGTNYQPLIYWQPNTSDLFYVQVTAYSGSPGGAYELVVSTGVGDPIFDNATPLVANQDTFGTITSDDTKTIQSLSLYTYGDMYVFHANAGEIVTIDCMNASTSSLDTQIYLFDQRMVNLYSDDDGGENYNSQIYYSLPEDGNYYVLVTSHQNDYSPEYRYNLYLTK
jgi:hypothetical protein